MPSTPASVKERCKFYLGGEGIDEDDFFEPGERRLTLALGVDLATRGQSWQLSVRLPQLAEAGGTIRLRTAKRGSYRQINLEAVQTTSRDYRISPNVGKVYIEPIDDRSASYLNSLKSSLIEIDAQRGFLFRETRQQNAALSGSVQLGGRYFIVSHSDLKIPTSILAETLKTDATSEDYVGWSCRRILLPDLADDELASWFTRNCRIPLRPASCRIEIIYPPAVGEGRDGGVTRILPSDEILIAFEQSLSDDRCMLAYSEEPEESTVLDLTDVGHSSTVLIPTTTEGYLALGFASQLEESNWDISHYLRPISNYTPLSSTISIATDDSLIVVPMIDERLEQHLNIARMAGNTIVSIDCQRSSGVRILARSAHDCTWIEQVDAASNPQRLGAILSDNKLDIRIEFAGIIVADLPCARTVPTAVANLISNGVSNATSWHDFAIARRRQHARPRSLPVWATRGNAR